MNSLRDSTQTRQLLENASQGDQHAFDSLFSRHRKKLEQVISLRLDRRLRRRLDPSDVVQETQLEAFRLLDDYLDRRPMPFELWLRKTAHQQLGKIHRRHFRASRRSVRKEVLLPDRSSLYLLENLRAKHSSPSNQIARREKIKQVRTAIEELSETDREVLLMRYVENLTNQEIACILDLSADAVSKRHGRALVRLGKALDKHDLGESDS